MYSDCFKKKKNNFNRRINMKNDIILKALEFDGMEAVEGSTADPRLAEFLERFFNKGFDPETEAWCSAFLNACCKAVGSPLSGSPRALSWLSAGIPTQKPEMGDIAVFWRESPYRFLLDF